MLKTLLKRVGKTIQQWRGMDRQADPASVAEDKLVTLTNCRWNGGAIVERGGQSKLLASPLSTTFVTGIYDSSIGGSLVGGTSGGGGGGGGSATGGGGGGATTTGDGPKIYWPADTAGPTQRWVMFQDEEKAGAPYSSNVFEIDTTIAQTGAGSIADYAVQWNGQLWWVIGGSSGGGWGLYSQAPVYGADRPLPIRRTWTVATVTGLNAGLCVWRGKLYATVSTTVASDNPITYEYDGVTLKQFDDSGFVATNTNSQPFGYQDRLYVGNRLANNNIRNVTIAGTGANCTMPSTVFQLGTSRGHAFAEYKGTLYVCGSDGNGTGAVARGVIYSTTGTTFAVARDLGTPPSPNTVLCLAVFNDFLYYSWSDGATGASTLGRFDGTTWTDVHHAFSLGPPVEGLFSQMFTYKGNLVVISQDIAPDTPAFRSAGTDTTSWTAMQAAAAAGRERISPRAIPFY